MGKWYRRRRCSVGAASPEAREPYGLPVQEGHDLDRGDAQFGGTSAVTPSAKITWTGPAEVRLTLATLGGRRTCESRTSRSEGKVPGQDSWEFAWAFREGRGRGGCGRATRWQGGMASVGSGAHGTVITRYCTSGGCERGIPRKQPFEVARGEGWVPHDIEGGGPNGDRLWCSQAEGCTAEAPPAGRAQTETR